MFVLDNLKEWGWDARIVEYEVLLNYPEPASVALEIVRPDRKELPVREDPYHARQGLDQPRRLAVVPRLWRLG